MKKVIIAAIAAFSMNASFGAIGDQQLMNGNEIWHQTTEYQAAVESVSYQAAIAAVEYQAAIDAVAEVIGQAEILAVSGVTGVAGASFVGGTLTGGWDTGLGKYVDITTSSSSSYISGRYNVVGGSWRHSCNCQIMGFGVVTSSGVSTGGNGVSVDSFSADGILDFVVSEITEGNWLDNGNSLTQAQVEAMLTNSAFVNTVLDNGTEFLAAIEGVTAVTYQAAIDAVAAVVGQDAVAAVLAVAERAAIEGRDPVEAVWEFLMYSEEEKEEKSNEPAPQPETTMSVVISVDFQTDPQVLGFGITGGRNAQVLLRISLITGQLEGHPQLLVFYDNDYDWNIPTQAVFLYPADAKVWDYADGEWNMILRSDSVLK